MFKITAISKIGWIEADFFDFEEANYFFGTLKNLGLRPEIAFY